MAAGGRGEIRGELQLTGDGVRVCVRVCVRLQLQAGGRPPAAGPHRLVDLDGDEEEAGDEADEGHQAREHQQFVLVFLDQNINNGLLLNQN